MPRKNKDFLIRKPRTEEEKNNTFNTTGKVRGTTTTKRGISKVEGNKITIKDDKLDEFIEEFLANGGNATRAALKVYNCTTMASAGQAGYRALKRATAIGRIVLETQGYGYGKMLEVATKKMEESKGPEWWDRLMKLAEYEDFVSKKGSGSPVNVNVFQANKDFISDYVEGEEANVLEDKNED